jgi:hypothetical protein
MVKYSKIWWNVRTFNCYGAQITLKRQREREREREENHMMDFELQMSQQTLY